ncbi:MAG: glycosyltransferase family 4 protein [Lentisphaeria bacterium]|nr:glycosyltransferase family 4 protein [Lentisphaeria bacterium]
MKICHVITRMIVGGAQENTFLSARGAVEDGHECVLLTGPTTGREGKLLSRVHNPGVKVVETPYLVREISPLTDLKAVFALKKFFEENQFDVVHTHTSKAGIIGRIAGKLAKVPVVTHTIHGLAFGPYEGFLKNLIYVTSEKISAYCCDRTYAVAQAMIDQCLERGIGRKDLYKVVYSGMELDKFLNARPEEELRRSLNIPPGRKVIGAIARLFPRKGYEELIPAFGKVVEKYPDTHLLIVGDGPARSTYEKMLAEMEISDHVSFAGLVSPDEVCRYVALMDVACHLSLKEGLPRVAVQALAEGKAVVAYDLDGTPEVVRTGETGVLIRPLDWQGAADALCRLLENPTELERMGQNGRQLVRDLFPWKRMSDILLEDYALLLGKKKKTAK